MLCVGLTPRYEWDDMTAADDHFHQRSRVDQAQTTKGEHRWAKRIGTHRCLLTSKMGPSFRPSLKPRQLPLRETEAIQVRQEAACYRWKRGSWLCTSLYFESLLAVVALVFYILVDLWLACVALLPLVADLQNPQKKSRHLVIKCQFLSDRRIQLLDLCLSHGYSFLNSKPVEQPKEHSRLSVVSCELPISSA